LEHNSNIFGVSGKNLCLSENFCASL